MGIKYYYIIRASNRQAAVVSSRLPYKEALCQETLLGLDHLGNYSGYTIPNDDDLTVMMRISIIIAVKLSLEAIKLIEIVRR